jgi:hypothetical protein
MKTTSAPTQADVSVTGQVLAPSPAIREWPEVPADLSEKYAQRQVVISAVVDKEGKVSHITVKRTPDRRVSNPIAQALRKWIFHPAQVNSQPVAVKILIGIPLERSSSLRVLAGPMRRRLSDVWDFWRCFQPKGHSRGVPPRQLDCDSGSPRFQVRRARRCRLPRLLDPTRH